jgi:hypothetical protein
MGREIHTRIFSFLETFRSGALGMGLVELQRSERIRRERDGEMSNLDFGGC